VREIESQVQTEADPARCGQCDGQGASAQRAQIAVWKNLKAWPA